LAGRGWRCARAILDDWRGGAAQYLVHLLAEFGSFDQVGADFDDALGCLGAGCCLASIPFT